MSYWLVSCDISEETTQQKYTFKEVTEGARLMSIIGSNYEGQFSDMMNKY